MLSKKQNMFLFSKPCHVLNVFLTFWPLKPYFLIWFLLIKKHVMKRIDSSNNKQKTQLGEKL